MKGRLKVEALLRDELKGIEREERMKVVEAELIELGNLKRKSLPMPFEQSRKKRMSV